MSHSLLKLGGGSSARIRRFGCERETNNRRSRREKVWEGEGLRATVEQRQLSLRELVREALFETVVGAGLAFVMEVLEAERAEVCGPRYRHDQDRSAHRAAGVNSSLVLGGRRVEVKRPRARTLEGEEVVLPSCVAWSAQDPLEKRAVEQMVLGVSTRRYGRSLELGDVG